MRAQALLDYFDQHTEECEKFLLDHAEIGDGYVLWQGDTPNKRVLIACITLGVAAQQQERVGPQTTPKWVHIIEQ